jgi:hypothetical protein
MGFLLASLGLLVLFVTIIVFGQFYGDDWKGLFEAITGYGLGGSSIALFGRVGGGIYTKVGGGVLLGLFLEGRRLGRRLFGEREERAREGAGLLIVVGCWLER